jgi:hypothetical protein
MKRQLLAGFISVIVAIGGAVGFGIWYTQTYAQHACQALDVLTRTPVAYPADPKANPSRVTLYQLYEGLDSWKRSDHC